MNETSLVFVPWGNTIRMMTRHGKVPGRTDSQKSVATVLVTMDTDCLLTQFWLGILPLGEDARLLWYLTEDDWDRLRDIALDILPGNILQAAAPFLLVVCDGFVVDHIVLPLPGKASPHSLLQQISQQLQMYELPPV